MGQFGIGQAVTRFEDRRLLQGGGRYLDDVNLPGQAYGVIVRSIHAHARIRGLDARAALKAPTTRTNFAPRLLLEPLPMSSGFPEPMWLTSLPVA